MRRNCTSFNWLFWGLVFVLPLFIWVFVMSTIDIHKTQKIKEVQGTCYIKKYQDKQVCLVNFQSKSVDTNVTNTNCVSGDCFYFDSNVYAYSVKTSNLVGASGFLCFTFLGGAGTIFFIFKTSPIRKKPPRVLTNTPRHVPRALLEDSQSDAQGLVITHTQLLEQV